jgi:hypothetical protein
MQAAGYHFVTAGELVKAKYGKRSAELLASGGTRPN